MKKFLSLFLAFALMFSTISVASASVVSDMATVGDENKIYFEPDTAGWKNYKKVFCHLSEYGGDSFYTWQSKKESCTYNSDGRWCYDLDARGIKLEPDTLYVVVFSNENGMQTYNLLMDSTCIGDTAYCNYTVYEDPEDSSKTVRPAFWRNMYYKEFGPEMRITSIGNVIGTCVPFITTAQDMFEEFLISDLDNVKTKTGRSEQDIIDLLAWQFNFNISVVEKIIINTGLEIKWRDHNSNLEDDRPSVGGWIKPVHPIVSDNVICFDADTAKWNKYWEVYCHISEYGGDSFFEWQSKEESCRDDDRNGVWTYDLDDNGVVLKPGVLYIVIFSCENGSQIYNLLFDISCLGDTAYCVETWYDDVIDVSRKNQVAFWCNQDESVFGPERQITSTGDVIGTCIPFNTSALALFEHFLINNLDNARKDPEKADQEIVDDLAYTLNLSIKDIETAIDNTGVSVYWRAKNSSLRGDTEDVLAVKNDKCKYELNIQAESIWGNFADRIYCHIYSEDKNIAFYKKGDINEQCVKNSDGTWSYNLKDNGIVLEDYVDYQVEFYSSLPTIPSTPVMNINSTYLDYTLLYEFADNEYKWKYFGDLSNIYPSKIPLVNNENVIYIDVEGGYYPDKYYKSVTVDIGPLGGEHTKIECERVTESIWKADFEKNNFAFENGVYYEFYADYAIDYDSYYEEPVDVVEPNGKSTFNIIDKTYLGYVYELHSRKDFYNSWEHNDKYIEYILGDVNGDGNVNIMDATEIQRHIAQLSTIPEDRLSCADANKDSQVNIMDATQIQRFIAQLIPEL